MSRALHEHKERTDRLIADLTARVVQLEAGHAHKTASDHSTLLRPERAQFFDISDHDVDVPRPTDLPPATGSFFSGRQPSVIPRSSLLGPIDHGSPPGCNAAPAEKASTAQSQTSSQTLDEILRRAKLRVSPEQAGNESRAPINPSGLNADNFAQQSAHFSGRSPIQAVPVTDAAGAASGEIPTEYARPSRADDRCHNPTISAFAPESRPRPTFPCQISYDTRTVPSGTGPSRWYNSMLWRANFVGGNAGISIVQSSTGTFTLAPTAPVTMTLGSRKNADISRRQRWSAQSGGGGGGPLEVSIPRRFDPVGGPPVLTPSSASDVQEYLASSHAAMIAVAIRCASVLSASSGKPATHPAQVTQGPEPRKGMGLRVEPEPEPAQLRRWIVEMKERVANAFAYDPAYALAWVEIPDGTRYEDLADECKYGMLENECNSAFRDCIKSIALKNKVQKPSACIRSVGASGVGRSYGCCTIFFALTSRVTPHSSSLIL